jgi:hypothetical protein
MPAFGEVLGLDQLELIMGHVRSFCRDEAWPRGELNLPRALFTEKAYPEDEAVISAAYSTEGPDAVETKLVYEQRFGARNQFELVLPLGWHEGSPDDPGGDNWNSSVGDLAVGVKRAFWHDHERGSILSVTGEVILPTGDEEAGFGKGTTVFEPFLSYGQLLPADFFLHGQAGFELPADTDEADREAFLRLAAGRTITFGSWWGRAWSPMVELLVARDLVNDAETKWDAVPQFQVTLNTRQHVMLNVGFRTPLNQTAERETQLVAYLLWDWFDGGFFDGW